MKKSVALFDFDNTLAQGDSITRLINHDLKRRPWHILLLFPVGIYYVGHKLHLCSFEKAKEKLLFPLRYMSEEQLNQFYQDEVAIHYYQNVVEELKQKKAQGYFVVVCTASSEAYMKYHNLPIDAMLGTRVEDGKIIGKNCKNEEKIPRILSCLKEHDIEIDYESSYGYSDSSSDIPMLSLVGHKKRVLLKTGKIVDFK